MTEREPILLSVVVVTFNSRHVLGENLSRLASMPDVEVIVFDNASTDGTQEFVRHQLPHVELIESTENLGFAKAVNRAAARAHGRMLMLFNPDASIGVDDVRLLAETSDSHPGDVVAPFIEQPAPQRIVSAGWMPSCWRMFTHYSGLSRLGKWSEALQGHYLLPAQVTGTTRVEWVTGACLVVPMTTWSAVGGLSERWFMYAEDIDFCHRVGEAGQSVWIVPRARATHMVGGSDSSHSMSMNAAWVLNLRDFYATSLRRRPFAVWIWTLIVAGGLSSRALVATVRRGGADPTARAFRAYSAALIRGGR
ncbi:glycosyltransferase family 2 protein [Curtobacterium sp. SL109]|uniref:glycosyltransferase family 2 protein n=1 Tax=Curtobacterium sp. SL109 TaxID=2994662 RepID=UPI0022754581|nr:glycosyltransferase family 2 protein [Curtobacterium sp. SL109]MCY1694136.1 glycosyltransferase family 2 protein [Curtobacterium sp. SL109]